MEPPDPYDLSGPQKIALALRHAAFVLQHVWPLVLVVGVPLAVGGAFLYRSYAPPVVVEPTQSPRRTAAWGDGDEPAASPLLVASEPAGASVFVDGDSVGTTPFRVENLRAGAARVSLRLAGFVRADTLVTLAPTTNTVVEMRLEPADRGPQAVAETVRVASDPPPAAAAPPASLPPAAPESPATGSVDVTVRPWGTISIDGNVRQRDTDVAFRENLAPGTYRVRVEHPTLGAREQSVRVQSGRTARLFFDLNAAVGDP